MQIDFKAKLLHSLPAMLLGFAAPRLGGLFCASAEPSVLGNPLPRPSVVSVFSAEDPCEVSVRLGAALTDYARTHPDFYDHLARYSLSLSEAVPNVVPKR